MTQAAPNPPDLAESLPCPLCAYDLRGLTDPRCPECGYTFPSFQALAESHRTRHPYLFEHHRTPRSFVRTLTAHLVPRRFWRTLTPLHPVRPGRLILYWLLILALAAPFAAVPVVASAQAHWRSTTFNRANMVAILAMPANARHVEDLKRHYGSIQACLDQLYPAPTVFSSTSQALLTHRVTAFSYAAFALWPAATAAVLMLYRRSTRQAKVRHVQVFRCTTYAADVIAWPGLLALLLYVIPTLASLANLTPQIRFVARLWFAIHQQPLLLWLPAVALATYRLTTAYSTYLRMSRAWLAIPLAQVIVLLLYLQLYVIVFGLDAQ